MLSVDMKDSIKLPLLSDIEFLSYVDQDSDPKSTLAGFLFFYPSLSACYIIEFEFK